MFEVFRKRLIKEYVKKKAWTKFIDMFIELIKRFELKKPFTLSTKVIFNSLELKAIFNSSKSKNISSQSKSKVIFNQLRKSKSKIIFSQSKKLKSNVASNS